MGGPIVLVVISVMIYLLSGAPGSSTLISWILGILPPLSMPKSRVPSTSISVSDNEDTTVIVITDESDEDSPEEFPEAETGESEKLTGGDK